MRSCRFEAWVRCWVNWTLPLKEVALRASVRRSCAVRQYFTAVCLCWLLYAERLVSQALGGMLIPLTSNTSSQLERLLTAFCCTPCFCIWLPTVRGAQHKLYNYKVSFYYSFLLIFTLFIFIYFWLFLFCFCSFSIVLFVRLFAKFWFGVLF